MHTPGFAPPEQHKLHYLPTRLGTHTDLYAIGCSMYSCINGNPPEVSVDRLGDDPGVPSEIAWMGNYSPWLLKLIDNLMVLEWDKRPKDSDLVWRVIESARAINYENPIKAHLNKMISRTQEN